MEDVGAKDMGNSNFNREILEFSMKTGYRFVRNHVVSLSFFLFLIILRIFLPSVFFFLLYSSPILVCIGFYLRNNSKFGPSNIDISSKEAKFETESSLSAVKTEPVSSNSKKNLRQQRSVRRNARRKVEEVGKDWFSQESEEEKDKVILTSIYNELLGRRTPPSFEESSDETKSPRKSLSDQTGENSSYTLKDPFEKLTSGWDETGVDSSEEDEETKKNGNKAVEWNETDQKNLMDLGFSEIERNKRLERLIARRRARKLFLLAAEKSFMDMEIPSICVARNYYDLDLRNTYGFDGLQMPGSAPSVMLPSRNPFDIPYDPQEEKPNLTGDSFHQEFAVINQKDVFFCRHESFYRDGHFPLGYIQDSKLESYKRKNADGVRVSRPGAQFDKKDNDDHPVQKVEPLPEQHNLAKETNPKDENENHIGEEINGDCLSPKIEVQIETDSIRKDDSDSDHSSSKETENEFNTGNKSEETSDQHFGKGKYQLRLKDHIRSSLTGISLPRDNGSSSLGSERQRYMENFGYSTRNGRHFITHSMDSDLHVEVSEIGSPPTTVGENDSSDDEKTSFLYESDIGKEMDFSSEETEHNKRRNGNGFAFDSGKKEIESNSTAKEASPEKSEKGVDLTESPIVVQPQEADSEMVEESQKLPQNPADEIKISYDLDEQEQALEIDQESPKHDQESYKEPIGNRLPDSEKYEAKRSEVFAAEPTKPASEIDPSADSISETEISAASVN